MNTRLILKMNQNNSIGVLGFLGLIFVTLKLCGIINWSWDLVTLPFWLPFSIVIFCSLIFIIFMFILKLFTPLIQKRQREFRKNIGERNK